MTKYVSLRKVVYIREVRVPNFRRTTNMITEVFRVFLSPSSKRNISNLHYLKVASFHILSTSPLIIIYTFCPV